MQADAYAGFNRLYAPTCQPGSIIEVACWAHARRKFFDLARLTKAPIALEAVSRIDTLFAIEREINGLSSDERERVCHERSRPLVEALESGCVSSTRGYRPTAKSPRQSPTAWRLPPNQPQSPWPSPDAYR